MCVAIGNIILSCELSTSMNMQYSEQVIVHTFFLSVGIQPGH